MSLSLQPGVAVPENDTGGSARTPLEMLRGVTRHVATAESLEVVLQSIATALGSRPPPPTRASSSP